MSAIIFKIFLILFCLVIVYGGPPETSTTSINLTDNGKYIEQLTDLEIKLLLTYNRNVRPVKNDSARTSVNFFAIIQHIEEIDEIEQAMTVHGFMYWSWKDDYMTWDKTAYNNVDRITLHGWYLWKPDIVLYNTGAGVENGRQVNQYQHVWIQSDGTIMYFPFFSFRATCIFDFTDYPYDIQICPLILGSWSYTMKEVELVPFSSQAGITLAWNSTKTIVSGWELLSSTVNITYWNAMNKIRTDIKPPEDTWSQAFTEVNVWLKLRRHAPYFGVVVLLPAVMTSFCTWASFWTVTTLQGITVLLVNVIIQAVFTDDLLQKIPPSTGGVPRIVNYYAFNLTSTVVAIILLMLFKTIENFQDESARAVPSILAALVRARDNCQEALANRLGFRRHLDENDTVDEHQNDDGTTNDDEEDEANRQHGFGAGVSGGQSKTKKTNQGAATSASITWSGVADLLKKICFGFFVVFYFSFMFTWLC